jgi:hypothetical protein
VSEPKPSSERAWLDLERFRNARAFSYGGCVIAGLLVVALTATLLLRR